VAHYAPKGINSRVSGSDAAVVGQVVSISSPKWNSASGDKWCDPSDPSLPRTIEIQYRVVRVKVQQVIFSTDELNVEQGDIVEVNYVTPQKADVDLPDGSDLPQSVIFATPPEQATAVLLLNKGKTAFKEGDRDTITVEGGGWGQWLLDGPTARSAIPQRTVPAAALFGVLTSEKAKGPRGQPFDEVLDTSMNPLGGSVVDPELRRKTSPTTAESGPPLVSTPPTSSPYQSTTTPMTN